MRLQTFWEKKFFYIIKRPNANEDKEQNRDSKKSINNRYGKLALGFITMFARQEL